MVEGVGGGEVGGELGCGGEDGDKDGDHFGCCLGGWFGVGLELCGRVSVNVTT